MAAAEGALAAMERGSDGVAVWKSTSRVRAVPKGRSVLRAARPGAGARRRPAGRPRRRGRVPPRPAAGHLRPGPRPSWACRGTAWSWRSTVPCGGSSCRPCCAGASPSAVRTPAGCGVVRPGPRHVAAAGGGVVSGDRRAPWWYRGDEDEPPGRAGPAAEQPMRRRRAESDERASRRGRRPTRAGRVGHGLDGPRGGCRADGRLGHRARHGPACRARRSGRAPRVHGLPHRLAHRGSDGPHGRGAAAAADASRPGPTRADARHRTRGRRPSRSGGSRSSRPATEQSARPRMATLCRVGMSIGVDIGGTKILAGIVTDDGRDRLDRAAARRPATMRTTCSSWWPRSSTSWSSGTSEPIEGVGVGVAGLVDAERSRVYFAPNLRWSQVPVRALLEASTGLPVVVENDGNIAAWGEYRFGAGRGTTDLVLVTVGTGIGGGIVINGGLFRGSHGVAGEIGHINAVPDGRPCGCGRQRMPGAVRQRQRPRPRGSPARRGAAIRGRRPARPGRRHARGRAGRAHHRGGAGRATRWRSRRSRSSARGSAAASPISPRCSIPRSSSSAAGVSDAGDLLLASARQTLADKLIGQQNRPAPLVKVAELANLAGLVGAADLARQPRGLTGASDGRHRPQPRPGPADRRDRQLRQP